MNMNGKIQEHIPRANPAQATDSVLIAVMGATGSGKSSFINLASGSTLQVGNSLLSCTSHVEVSSTFRLDDKNVTLIDTPGFDDTNMSDIEVLNMIALFLASLYEQGKRLHGILYLYRISDPRMGGGARRNLNMFQQLCGNECLPNVVIVTNMWGEVAEEQGKARLQELLGDELFFKPALRYGARVRCHDRTTTSAKSIIQDICGNPPMTLRIQRELVIEGKDITETAAGIVLDEELAARRKKFNEELEELQTEMEEAKKSNDTRAAEELAVAQQELEKNLREIDRDKERLGSEYKQGRAELLRAQQTKALGRELQRERAETARTNAEIVRLRREVERQGHESQTQTRMLRQEAEDALQMQHDQPRGLIRDAFLPWIRILAALRALVTL